MISVRRNPNFVQFFQIFSFGRLVDEVKGQSKALRIAKSEAKGYDIKQVNFLGNILDTNDKI
jgi:hypothetical protein|tara:strand:+ start:571 stop:756 length:186 start_codon:yes stop_codon:yes gene_type:complete